MTQGKVPWKLGQEPELARVKAGEERGCSGHRVTAGGVGLTSDREPGRVGCFGRAFANTPHFLISLEPGHSK